MTMSPPDKHAPFNKFELDAAMGRIDAQLETAKSNRTKLDERERNYKELVGLLEELPSKVAHPIMVPFGPLAFFPGSIEHTNEVVTQLSSEFFVLRTAGRASELARKRLRAIQQEKASLSKSLHELQIVRGLASGEEVSMGTGSSAASVRRDEEGFMDIREPYDERAEQRKAAAAASVQQQPPTDSASGAHAGGAEVDMLARLRELERQEEMEELDEAVETAERNDGPGGGDALARMRELEQLEEMEELDSIVEAAEHGGSAEAGPGARGAPALGSSPAPGSSHAAGDASTGKMLSPSDLFLHMRKVEEEGASRSSQATSASAVHAQQRADSSRSTPEVCPPVVGPDVRQAVRERVGAAADVAPAVPAKSDSVDDGAPKRVSKFKADRLKGRG